MCRLKSPKLRRLKTLFFDLSVRLKIHYPYLAGMDNGYF
jgi:hypothetical protein